MDFPPFIAIVSRTIRGLFGDSITMLRVVPALACAGLVTVAGLSARELGGGRLAQGLAALAVLASPVYLRAGALFQPVALDQLWWSLGLLFLLKLTLTEDPRWWVAFGIAVGLGLLTKFSILLFGASVFLALILTRQRRWLATPWPWLAAGLAVLIGLPSLIGQIALGFPLLGQIGDLRGAQLSHVTPVSFLTDQPLMVPGFPLALLGIATLVVDERWRRYRLIGATALASFGFVMLAAGKSYYIAPIYPVLLGTGSVALTQITATRWRGILYWISTALLAVYLFLIAPIGLPLLPPVSLEAYQVKLGLEERVTETNVGGQERIPQDFADMLGWPDLVLEVARVYQELPPAERERTVILASNYGEAGAIDYYGGRLELPPARAFVGSYWFFGPGKRPGDPILLVGFDADDLSSYCGSVEAVGHVDPPYAVNEQRGQTLHLCREPRQSLQGFWPLMKGVN
jgi:4-amino-4-deoxy-L-arabinose transferase-like glycosyltransferase